MDNGSMQGGQRRDVEGEMMDDDDVEAGEAAAGVAAMTMSTADASSVSAFAAESSSFSKRLRLVRQGRMLVPGHPLSGGDAQESQAGESERSMDEMSVGGGGEYGLGVATHGSLAWCIALGMRGGKERIRQQGLEDFERASKELTRALQVCVDGCSELAVERNTNVHACTQTQAHTHARLFCTLTRSLGIAG